MRMSISNVTQTLDLGRRPGPGGSTDTGPGRVEIREPRVRGGFVADAPPDARDQQYVERARIDRGRCEADFVPVAGEEDESPRAGGPDVRAEAPRAVEAGSASGRRMAS